MSSTGRHATRHRYGTGSAAVVLAAIVASAGLLLLAALFTSGTHAGPVTGARGPQMVLRPPAASVQITVRPDRSAELAVWHRDHLAHEEHAEHAHAEHIRHLDYLNHLKISSE